MNSLERVIEKKKRDNTTWNIFETEIKFHVVNITIPCELRNNARATCTGVSTSIHPEFPRFYFQTVR